MSEEKEKQEKEGSQEQDAKKQAEKPELPSPFDLLKPPSRKATGSTQGQADVIQAEDPDAEPNDFAPDAPDVHKK